ncbi:MAG: hypothetical protein ACTSRS_12290 [Candidatus Helarchaeota archaeon]
MSEEEVPPIQYYEVLEFKTISRRGPWWILLALCRDTENEKVFLSFYKYQKRKNQDGTSYWQKKSSFRWNNLKHIPQLIESVQKLAEAWDEIEKEAIV